jgi:hypothetical protein
MRNDFEQSHHRQVFDALPRLATGGDHAGAGDAGEASLREALAQGFDELRAKVIPGLLSSDKDDEHRSEPYLTIPTRSRRGVESLRKATSGCSSGWFCARCSICSVASISFSCERYRMR